LHQELPACYFTRSFAKAKSYLGAGAWREESHASGPPWQRVVPPKKAMAFFESGGQGVAIFSPAASEAWNFGSHREGHSKDPLAGPCMHVAPIRTMSLSPKSSLGYHYWLVVGDEASISSSLDLLWKKYSGESVYMPLR
jgi:hypothetical protein